MFIITDHHFTFERTMASTIGLFFPVSELWFLPEYEGTTVTKEKHRRLSRRSSSIDDAFSGDAYRRSDSNDSVFDALEDMSPFFSNAERKRLLQYFGIYLAEKCKEGYDIPSGASSRRTIILISTCEGRPLKTRCELQNEDFLIMMGKWLHSSPDANIHSFILCDDKLSNHYDEMYERPISQLHALLLEEEKKQGLFYSPAVTALRMMNPNLQMTFARESIRKMGQLSSTFIFDFIRKLSSSGCILPSEENLLNLVDSGWTSKRIHRDTKSHPSSKSTGSKFKTIYVRDDILETNILELVRHRKVLLDRGRAIIDRDLFHIGFDKWILSIVLKRMGKKMYSHLQFLKQNEAYVRDPADKQLLKLNSQLNSVVVKSKGFGAITMETAPDCIKALHTLDMKDMIRFNLATIFANMFKVKDNHMAYTQFIESISKRSSINYGRRSVIRQRIDAELAKVMQAKRDMSCRSRQRIFGDNSKLGIVCPYSSPEGCLATRAGTISEKPELNPDTMAISDVWLHTNPK